MYSYIHAFTHSYTRSHLIFTHVHIVPTCSLCVCVLRYDKYAQKFNTEANEQENKELKSIATQLHYMKGTEGVRYLKTWCGIQNDRRRRKLIDGINNGQHDL